MKPLLRVVLIVDALMLLGFGALFLLTPWTSLYDALQLVQPQPALVGQVLGVVLLGFAWLAVRAAFDGAMTAPVGRVAGHVNWIAGVLALVWLIGLHTPRLTGFGQLVAGGTGVWLILIGFGVARLAGAVRRRDKAQAAEAATAQRDARLAEKREARQEPVGTMASTSPAAPAFAGLTPAASPPGRTPDPAVQPTPAQPATRPSASAEAGEGREDARLAARDEAAGAPRPPLHG